MSLKLLWQLQELDLAIEELELEIENNPLRQEVDSAEEQLGNVEEALSGTEQDLKEQRKKLKRGELDLEAISSEHEALHQRLYSGEVKNIKELEQMEIKLRSVKQKQEELEEELLGLMEAIEEQERRAADLAGQQKEISAELQQRRQRLDEELARLGNDMEKLQEQRKELVSQIEPQYLERYRELSRRFQGQALARVINDICQGCSVFISSAQRGHLYDPRAMVYCESCGRLLIRFSEEEAQLN
ncbi:MAG TPA: hypothetical protein PKV91_06905 [Bacillota bacterium]|nr:hypothetical protein [Bacillota bacterium]HOA36036.1 hypothetical protein [Bacillota bacterium]HOJ84704.1 hypothetical protein [Bacillota bacterium]HOL15789.1 hypothetical protein [Bacillota bacterium]HPZ12068.1 hypothetical protein [Bacillota bacterium]